MTRARGRAPRLRLADRLLVEKLTHPTFKSEAERLAELIEPEPKSVTDERLELLRLATRKPRR